MVRILGTTGSGRRRRYQLGALLSLLALLALIAVPNALAVHDDGLFELGDATGSVGSADIVGDGVDANGPDWDDLFDSDPNVPPGDFNAAVASFGGVTAAFIADDLSAKGPKDATTFSGAGGSNKNNDAISAADCAARVPPLTGSACDTWHWDEGNVPIKDDLSNVYAYAAFDPVSSHLIFYIGFERLDPNGDSHIDVEFLQDSVALDEAPKCNDPGADPTPCAFTGIRTVGDLIVSMDFVQGGGIGEVDVRSWNGTEYALAGAAVGEGCNGADTICAVNNGSTINGGDWPNFGSGGAAVTDLEPNAFSEVGVDVTALIGGDPCITTLMGKTRSSQSFTAELKDFAGPTSFPICGANISIEEDDVNRVGQQHTFTVTVNKVLGQTETPVADGTDVDVTLTGSNGIGDGDIVVDSSSTCDVFASDGTTLINDGSGTSGGTCTVVFTANKAGKVTGHAEADVVVGGQTIHVETGGSGGKTGDAVKFFVDAFITIAPNDTNSIGESHTFTVTVQQNDGSGGGFGNAPDGTVVTVTLAPSGGAVVSDLVDNCASSGTVNGTCTVSFTSNTAGTVVGHASVTLTFTNPFNGDVTVTRETNGNAPNSGDATKVFVAGSLAWSKVDNAGNLQGGATFEVCRTHNLNTETGNFVDIDPDVCVTVVDDTGAGGTLDEDPDAGEFLLTGLRLGRYTVDETVAPPGFEPDPKVETRDLTLANPDVTILFGDAFVNQRPILKLTEFGYTNEPTGTPTAGVVSGMTTYTVKLKNFGGASVSLSGTLEASAAGLGVGGTFGCTGGDTLAISGTLAPNGAQTFTLTCTYNNAADAAVVTANLSAVDYTLNSLTRTASGTPALISFTIQSD